MSRKQIVLLFSTFLPFDNQLTLIKEKSWLTSKKCDFEKKTKTFIRCFALSFIIYNSWNSKPQMMSCLSDYCYCFFMQIICFIKVKLSSLAFYPFLAYPALLRISRERSNESAWAISLCHCSKKLQWKLKGYCFYDIIRTWTYKVTSEHIKWILMDNDNSYHIWMVMCTKIKSYHHKTHQLHCKAHTVYLSMSNDRLYN